MLGLKILGGFAVIALVRGVGDYEIPQLAPAEYVGVTGASWLPLILVAFPLVGYLLALWGRPTAALKSRPGMRALARAAIFCVFFVTAVWAPLAYVNHEVQFIPISGDLSSLIEKTHEIESAVGFKVGCQMGSRGRVLFFRRVPGAFEKVDEWIRTHDASHRLNG